MLNVIKRLASLASTVAAIALGAGAAEANPILVDIPSWDSAGTNIPLDAGVYRVSFTGIAGGGQFDAWNPTGTVSGCDDTGANCTSGWLLSVGVDLGSPSGFFEHIDGNQYVQSSADGNTHIYSTAAAAQAQIGGAALLSAWLIEADDPASYHPTNNPFSFTLGMTQVVNFFIRDDSYENNSGGVSLHLERLAGATPPVPEPASWAMMIAGFGLAGATMRARAAHLQRATVALSLVLAADGKPRSSRLRRQPIN